MERPDHPWGWLETASAAPVEGGAGSGDRRAYRCGAPGTHRTAAGLSPRPPPPFPEDAGGTWALRRPPSRDGSFSTEVFGRYQRSEPALIRAMMERGLQGVSTRKVRKITEAVCGTPFSKRTVSRLCAQRDARVTAFKARSRAAAAYPFVLVDAMGIQVRPGEAVRPMSLLIAGGVHADGVREISGFEVAAQESGHSWSDWFTQRLDRGLPGVELVVSDRHPGRVRAIAPRFPSAQWPRGQVHWARNVRDRCPPRWPASRRPLLHQLFNSCSQAAARPVFAEMAEE